MESTKEDLERHLAEAHEDPKRQNPRKSQPELLNHREVESDFENKTPTYNEFHKKLCKTRSKSAPGPNGSPILSIQEMSRSS